MLKALSNDNIGMPCVIFLNPAEGFDPTLCVGEVFESNSGNSCSRDSSS